MPDDRADPPSRRPRPALAALLTGGGRRAARPEPERPGLRGRHWLVQPLAPTVPPADVWAVDGGQGLVADARCLQVYVTRAARVRWQRRAQRGGGRGDAAGPSARGWARSAPPWLRSARRSPRTPRWTSTCCATGASGRPSPQCVAACRPGGMVLVDGDLQPDWRIPSSWLAALLAAAAARGVTLVGVTKHSSLSRGGGAAARPCSSGRPRRRSGPRACWWVPVARTRPDVGPGLQVVVARLDPDARFSFRVDLPGRRRRRRRDVLGALSALSDDAAFPGYPYPLSVADRLAACSGLGPRRRVGPDPGRLGPGRGGPRRAGAGVRRPPPADGAGLMPVRATVLRATLALTDTATAATHGPARAGCSARNVLEGHVPGRPRRGSLPRRAAGRRRRGDRPPLPVPGGRRHLRHRAPRAGLGRAGGRDPAGRRRAGRDRPAPPARAGRGAPTGWPTAAASATWPRPNRARAGPRRCSASPRACRPSSRRWWPRPPRTSPSWPSAWATCRSGKLRSGETVVDFAVGIPGSSLATHVGIFATTGMGKSNLMQVLAAGVMRANGRYGLLVIDPHGEYRAALARHPWAATGPAGLRQPVAARAARPCGSAWPS